MRVLVVNQSDIQGGASLAGYRLHQELGRQGAHSRLLVGRKHSEDASVSAFPNPGRWENAAGRISRPLGLNYVNLGTHAALGNSALFREADVVNYHNLHSGYFNYLALAPLTRRKPSVLTLHDMWSFTGHCVYSMGCERWRTGCGSCPQPDSYPAIQRDATAWEWRLKRHVYARARLAVVSPSRWLAGLAAQSLLARFPITCIPYGLDLAAYRPMDRAACRRALGLPEDHNILLFAAESLKDPRKGMDLLRRALAELPPSARKDVLLLTFGGGIGSAGTEAGLPAIHLGQIGGDRLKATVYSAADAFVFPSRADNLPLVIQEAMACGLPVVSFAVGGIPELVAHGVTGLLAPAEDTAALAALAAQLLARPEWRRQLRVEARRVAEREFPMSLQATRYLSLFRELRDRA
jgi:glycosyltransferase involved in cell wall biosynthesis